MQAWVELPSSQHIYSVARKYKKQNKLSKLHLDMILSHFISAVLSGEEGSNQTSKSFSAPS